MTERSFDEMIAYFNRRVADMDIGQDSKIELFGMVAALGYKHKKSAQPELLKCKDCYWWTTQEDSMQGRCARYKFYPTGYWYCAAARERRTDD